VRLFVAIYPDPPTQTWLVEAHRRLRTSLARFDRELRWVDPEAIHITLSFLGKMPEAEPIVEALQTCRCVPMDLAVGGLGVFPSSHHPKVLWTGVSDAAGALCRLQAEIASAMAPFVEPESRRFEPHLTLARVRPGRHSRISGALAKAFTEWGDPSQPWHLEGFSLMQSELTPRGARHSVVQTFGPSQAGMNGPEQRSASDDTHATANPAKRSRSR